MRARYQRGYLRLGHRKTGPDCWEFLWWDIELTGQRIRRKAVIGTVQQYQNIREAATSFIVHYLSSIAILSRVCALA